MATSFQGFPLTTGNMNIPTTSRLLRQHAQSLVKSYIAGGISITELTNVSGYTEDSAAYLILSIASMLTDEHELNMRAAISSRIDSVIKHS